MKNNNFQQPQNITNYPINKNPFIQNFNYMFYLLPENPQIYNIQNLASPLFPLGFIPSYQQSQFQNLPNVPNIQNALPFFYNIGLSNLLQLSLLNSSNNLPQNQNLLPNINNINDFQNQNQNILPNNFLLNKKTFNQNHQEIEDEDPNQIQKVENEENNDLIQNDEENNFSPLKSDLKVESNSEQKSIEKIEEENIIKENKISEEKAEDILEEKDEKSEKNEISTTPLEEKEEEDKKEIKEKTKKKKKRRNNYKELLYDTILEHIGKEEKNENDNSIQLEEEISSIDNENNKKKEDNQKNKKTQNLNNQKNKPKTRTRNGKHSRKKQHKITLKNNKDILADLEENKNNEQNNSKWTKVIFHGKNYAKTENVADFMKYNFDFTIDEQYKSKKLITDCSLQHVDIKNINGNTNIYENYSYSEQHLDEIKIKWSREKFLGDDDELKNAIDTIRDGFHERKIYTNEEKYLDIIKNNNYNVDGYDNAKK
jgi:hypothetical protein